MPLPTNNDGTDEFRLALRPSAVKSYRSELHWDDIFVIMLSGVFIVPMGIAGDTLRYLGILIILSTSDIWRRMNFRGCFAIFGNIGYSADQLYLVQRFSWNSHFHDGIAVAEEDFFL